MLILIVLLLATLLLFVRAFGATVPSVDLGYLGLGFFALGVLLLNI